MKKLLPFLCLILCLSSLFGCSEGIKTEEEKTEETTFDINSKPTSYKDTENFSYAVVFEKYKENGVKTGFKNTEPFVLTGAEEAIERALNEYHGDYESAYVLYDSTMDFWGVCFKAEGSEKNVCEVYMNGKGITELVYYANN